MGEPFDWTAIKKKFQGQWVELVDLEWDWNSPHPKKARVRHNASQRTRLMSKVNGSDQVEDSVILYLGASSLVAHQKRSEASL